MNARTVTFSLTNDQVRRLLDLLDNEAVNAKNSLARATNEKLRTMYNARGEFAVAVAEQARCAIGEGTVKVFSLGWKARASLEFIKNGVADCSEDAFIQENEHVVDFREGQAGRDDAAIRQGAFGGYRQAIAQGVAERGLSDRFANIEAEGRQAAFSNAQQQFERDRAAGFTADATNESNRARAAGVQQQGAALGLQGADSFSRLAAADQGLAFQRGEALQKIGQQQQGLEQQRYDLAASDFANQRDFGRQQLNFYSGILRGVPVTAQSEVSRYDNPNPMNQLLGGGVAALGAYNQYMR
jgi:hypothetical protein